LHSPPNRLREVKDEGTREDTAKTSINGGFGLVTSDDGPVYRVKVAPKQIGNDRCDGAVWSAS